jgi:hypothetical protein
MSSLHFTSAELPHVIIDVQGASGVAAAVSCGCDRRALPATCCASSSATTADATPSVESSFQYQK